ncbi:MAG: dihydroorotate dehydrogenase [Candidatus Omnitrophica bacterium]|nr:dihydroorotate dehydrogenase [Candidatus Omnitrophota bacterium]
MNLKINIAGVTFKNPVWPASGTFGHGEDFTDFFDINKLGAIVTKTITLNERVGNPTPRIVETPSGMLNAIGLENKGLKGFINETAPFLKKVKTRIVISVAGSTQTELEECVLELLKNYIPDAIEINLSCPNVQHKGTKTRLFSQDADTVKTIVKSIKKKTKEKCLLISKLTPNVTDISAIAQAAEQGGSDAVSLVNTYLGMKIDINKKKPFLGNIQGGLSGPAIRPMAVRAVWDTYKTIKIPIIGMGGIMTGPDALEFILAGATSIQVGTANFINPTATINVLEGIEEYLKGNKEKNIKTLVGAAQNI